MQLVFVLLAKEFGVTPNVIAESPMDEVLFWWQMVIDLQPKERRR
jgi:hypothetical protein